MLNDIHDTTFVAYKMLFVIIHVFCVITLHSCHASTCKTCRYIILSVLVTNEIGSLTRTVIHHGSEKAFVKDLKSEFIFNLLDAINS